MAKRNSDEELKKIWELSSVWNVLSDEEKEYVDRHVSIHYFRKNEIIHHEGDIPTHMMMLAKGRVRVYISQLAASTLKKRLSQGEYL